MLLKWPNPGPENAGDPESGRTPLTMESLDRIRRGTAALLLGLTVLWLVLVGAWFMQSAGLSAIGLMLPHEVALVVIAAFVPPAFIWLAGFWYWRSVDSRHSRSALHAVLKDMAFPDPEAEARLNAMTLSLRRLSQALESETTNALTRVERLDERIGKGTEALSAAARHAAEQSDHLGQAITDRAEAQKILLSDVRALDSEIRTLGERQGQALGQAVAEAGRRTAEIEAALRTQLVAADDTVEQVAKRAGQINTMLEQPMARLREEADSTVRRVSGVSQDLRSRMEALSQVIARTMDQADGLREGVDSQIARLRDGLGNVQSTMTTVIAESRQQLGDLEEITGRSAESAGQSAEAIAARNASLARVLDDIGIVTAEAEQALQSTANRTWAATQRFAFEIETLGERGGEVSDRTEDMAGRIGRLTGDLAEIEQRLAANTGRMAESRDDLAASVAEMQGTAAQMIDNVEERLKAAASMAVASSERSEERVIAVADRLRASIAELSDYISTVESRAIAVAGRGDAQVEALGARAVELSDIMSSIDAAVAQGDTTLSGVVSRTESALAAVRHGLGDVGQAMDDMDQRTMRSAGLLAEHGEQIDELSTRVLNGMERMERAFALRSDALERLGLRVDATVEKAETDVTARTEAAATLLEKMAGDASLTVGRAAVAVRELLDEMGARTDRISASVASANTATTETTSQVDERVAELTLLLRDIERIVADTGVRVTEVEDRARGAVEGLEAGVGALGRAAVQLDSQAGNAALHLDSISDLMLDRTETLSTLVSRLSDAATDADSDVRARLEGLAATLEDAMASTRLTTTALAQQATRVEVVGGEVAGRIDVSIAHVDQRLAEAAQAADGAAARMAEKTAELALMVGDLGAAAGQAETSISDVRSGLDTVLAEISEGTTRMVSEVRSLGSMALRTSDTLKGSTDAVSARNQALLDSFSAAIGALADDGHRIGDLIQSLRDSVGAADTAISPSLDRMATRVQDASELARMMAESLEAGSGAMLVEAEQLRDRLAALTQDLDVRVKGLDTAADAVTTRVIGAAGEIELRAESLGALGARIGSETLAQAEALATHISTLATRVDESESRMSQSGQRIEDASGRSTAAARAATTAIGEAVSAIDAGLGRTGDMELAAGRLASVAEDSRNRIGAAADESLAQSRALAQESAQLTDQTRSLVEAAAGGAARLATALANARQETQRFTDAESRARAEAAEVVDALGARVSMVQQMSVDLKATGTDIDALLAARIDALSKAGDSARQTAGAVSGDLTDHQRQLEQMTATARDHAAEMERGITEAIARLQADFVALEQGFATVFDRLQGSTEQAEKGLTSALGRLQDETTAVEQGASAAATRLQGEATALGRSLLDAGKKGEGAARVVADAVAQLQAALATTRAEATDADAAVTASTAALERQRRVCEEAMSEAQKALGDAERILSAQVGAMASTSKAATMQSGLAAKAFEVQVGQLQKASKGAAMAAVELRDRTADNRDKRFLQSAAFVAEGLNSLSLDLHRLLDRDATETEWRKFYRGDRGFFARRLVARSEAKQIAALYRDGDDFRRFVDLYLNEFESLMLNVERADQQGMLSAVFLSADVGKLYLLLCEALEREPAGKRLLQRAS